MIARQTRLRHTLAAYEAAAGEMVRVYLRGRKNLRAAVCFTGYPHLQGRNVALYGTDGRPRAVIPLREIAAVQRVFTANPPKASAWFVAKKDRVPAPDRPVPTPVDTLDPEPIKKDRTIRATLELDITPALEQVAFVKKAVEDALDPKDDQ